MFWCFFWCTTLLTRPAGAGRVQFFLADKISVNKASPTLVGPLWEVRYCQNRDAEYCMNGSFSFALLAPAIGFA